MEVLKFRVVPDASGLAFQLVSETGEILLTGGGFSEREACIAGIQAVIDVLSDEDRYDIRAEAAGVVLALTAADNRLLAQSAVLRDDGATALRESLVELASEQEAYDIALPGTGTARSVTPLTFSDFAAVNPADLYDFDRASLTGLAGFELFQVTGEERYYFHVNDATGTALLYSREFRTASQRNQRMRMVAKCAVLKQRYERREENGRHFFILKARNGQEIARSRAFVSFAEMESALGWLLTEMPRFAEGFTKRASGRSRGKDGFNLALVSLSAVAGFELLRDAADKLYYFLFHSDDGNALLFSRGYTTRAGRDQAIQTLIRLSANPARFESTQTEEQYGFAIRTGNGQIIARSRQFDSAEAASAAMTLARTRIVAQAALFGVAVAELETTRAEQLTLRVDRERPVAPLVETQAEAVAPSAIVVPEQAEMAAPTIAAVPEAVPEQVVSAASLASPALRETAPVTLEQTILPAIPLESAIEAAPEIESVVVTAPTSPDITVPKTESASAVVTTAASAAVTPPVVPAGGKPAPEDRSRRKTGGFGWLAYAIPLLLLLVAAPFLLSRGCKTNATGLAGTSAPGRGQSSTQSAFSAAPPPPGRNGTPPPVTAGGETARATNAATPARSGSGASSSADTATVAAAPPAHRNAARMETALAAYLSGPQSAEPRAFTMDRLAYPPNSHEVNPAGKAEIRDLAHLLVRFPTAKITLHGHIDGREQEAYSGPNPRLGFPLSKLRADCVCRRLHFLGVDYSRMQFTGDGNAHPVADDSTADGRQQNRRMNIMVNPNWPRKPALRTRSAGTRAAALLPRRVFALPESLRRAY